MLAYSGKGRFFIRPIDLSALVQEMLNMLQLSISKKASLKLNLTHDIPATRADATQVRQVVMNLITNASEALEEKSGIIAVTTGVKECDQSYLQTADLTEVPPAGLYVYLEVADTGCGMDLETRTKIFDPFFSTKFTGRGLGLAAVLGIVRGHRGSLKVASKPGHGTTFEILLPASQSEAPASAPEKMQPEQEHQGGTVLVVDDEEPVRSFAETTLKRYGFEVLVARDGREAVDVFKKNADSIDAVLLDMTMPHLGGKETFQELRSLSPDIRVILSSGYNEQDATDRFASKGLAGFLQKPYRPQELVDTIQVALKNRRQ